MTPVIESPQRRLRLIWNHLNQFGSSIKTGVCRRETMDPRSRFRPVCRLFFSLWLACGLAVFCAARTKIGVLLKDKTPGFWVYAEKGAIEAGAALDVEVIVRAPPSVLDVSAQTVLLKSLAAEHIDALVIAATNPALVEPTVEELAKSGVKIVTINTPLKEGLAQVFVTVDQEAMSEAAAKIFLAIANDGEEVAMLRNNSVDRPVLTRENILKEAAKSRPQLTLRANIFASSERDSEEQQAKTLLEKYPKVTVVFASATRPTLALVKAVREGGLAGKVKVVGFGTYFPPEAVQAFEEGILYGWVAQQTKELGVKSVQSAAALVAGQSVPPVVRPDFLLITQENFRSPQAQALKNP